MLKTYIPLLLAGAAFEALGAQSCATLPPVAYADTEVSTNVPFTAWEAHQKPFE